MPTTLFARYAKLERDWPFVPERLVERLQELGEVRVLAEATSAPLSEQADLSDVEAIAHFGGQFTSACLAASPRLRAIGGVWDNAAHGLPVEELFERKIPMIDATRAWAPSVAETALGLALCSLRQMAHWHARMAQGEPLWEYAYSQFCDDPRFVNGDLGSKSVGVLGLGQIGSRIAQWCRALGSTVCGHDPFVPEERCRAWEVAPVDLDTLVACSEVLFVAVPPTPSARHLLNRERIGRLRRGALVVAVTRAHAIEMAALRERILADELAGAFDVYDVEPLPPDDPLRGRANVVHTPHIAGRTRDANLRVADVIADDFARVFRGEPAAAALTRQAIQVRVGRPEDGFPTGLTGFSG
jgi:D-3-phosphoglycerate dehydrogenase